MIAVSKNLIRGRRITSPQQILRNADEGKSLAWQHGKGDYAIKPASIFANWPLRLLQQQIISGRLFETRHKPRSNA